MADLGIGLWVLLCALAGSVIGWWIVELLTR